MPAGMLYPFVDADTFGGAGVNVFCILDCAEAVALAPEAAEAAPDFDSELAAEARDFGMLLRELCTLLGSVTVAVGFP